METLLEKWYETKCQSLFCGFSSSGKKYWSRQQIGSFHKKYVRWGSVRKGGDFENRSFAISQLSWMSLHFAQKGVVQKWRHTNFTIEPSVVKLSYFYAYILLYQLKLVNLRAMGDLRIEHPTIKSLKFTPQTIKTSQKSQIAYCEIKLLRKQIYLVANWSSFN